jgi:outer membrane protein assembly factor BamB
MKTSMASLLFSTSLLLLPLNIPAADWPQWRGPDRTDISKETGLLKSWPDGGPKQVWLYKNAGKGYASFAVVGGKLFTLGTRDDSDVLLALDAGTGKELWITKIGAVFTESRGDGTRGTPTVDGGFIYTLGGRGDLVCAQTADGKLVWTRTFQELGSKKRPNWGFSESVLVDGEKVVCTPGGSQGTIAALDKKTGKTLWQSKEFTDDAHYSSIIAVEHNGARQYIQITEKSVVGVSAKDGKLLWRSEWPGRTAVIPTPIFKDGHVFVTSGYGVGCKLIKLGPGNEASDVYDNKNMINHHGGVILLGDHLYGYSDGGGWTCQDFKTGGVAWNNKSLGKGSVTYADGMLYCLDEGTRTVALVEASPKGWNEKGRFKLNPQTTIQTRDNRIWTHPVVANGRLYLRDQDLIFCYDVKGAMQKAGK